MVNRNPEQQHIKMAITCKIAVKVTNLATLLYLEFVPTHSAFIDCAYGISEVKLR